MARVRVHTSTEKESEICFEGHEMELSYLKKSVRMLPLKKMGLEQFNDKLIYVCKKGKLGSIEIHPENKMLHSIWVPEAAKNVHSTEDYQAFTLKGVDYLIFRRPKNHIRKVYVY